MTVTPLGWDQDCSLKIREPEVPAPWFLDPEGWSKPAAVRLYFIFPGICTLSLANITVKESENWFIPADLPKTQGRTQWMEFLHTSHMTQTVFTLQSEECKEENLLLDQDHFLYISSDFL
ncbi:hypothetical protein STEG23_028101 [Scotinomys teguina]